MQENPISYGGNSAQFWAQSLRSPESVSANFRPLDPNLDAGLDLAVHRWWSEWSQRMSALHLKGSAFCAGWWSRKRHVDKCGQNKRKSTYQINDKCLVLLVHPEGFGPPTPGFEVRCSIQLSYGCMSAVPMDTMFMDQGQRLCVKKRGGAGGWGKVRCRKLLFFRNLATNSTSLSEEIVISHAGNKITDFLFRAVIFLG